MSRIVLAFLLATAWLDAHAQSSLLPCPSDTSWTQWTNCNGKLTLSSGSAYAGDFRDGRFHGQGGLSLVDGSNYIGGFKNGQFDGQGTLVLPGGVEYIGAFKAGKFNGKGTLTLADGGKHVGDFKDGALSGVGAFISAKGYTIVAGTWRDEDVETESGRWRFAASTSSNWFVLTKSIRQEGGFRRAWVMFGENQPNPQTGHLSARALIQFDCVNERSRLAEVTFFSGSFGIGEILGSHRDDTWSYVAPGTANSTVMTYVCNRKLPSVE